jgi:hypothetical protein
VRLTSGSIRLVVACRQWGAEQRKLGRELDELLRELKFDEGYDSPRRFDPTHHQ